MRYVQETAIFFLYHIIRLVFVIETRCVFCEAGTKCLYIIYMAYGVQKVTGFIVRKPNNVEGN